MSEASRKKAVASSAARGGRLSVRASRVRYSLGLAPCPDADGTRVLFRHTGRQPGDPGLPQAAYTWGQLMTRLKDYAETGRPPPFFTL
ncbi:hypothetical protein [Streptomyces sp. 2A115]|uniref:hypothetical protein n=1 Tax=Streptomyces sp. 2A115 TaxID=3457439 RepID=UPI003FD0A044